MNLADGIILLIIGAVVFFAFRVYRRSVKNGSSCCSGCSACSDCSACAGRKDGENKS